MMKKFLSLLLIYSLTTAGCYAGGTIATYVIDPEKNAYDHNNKGVVFVEEKNYYGAIQEFKMAISLNPKTQATAVYFNNLGKVYMTIGYPDLALDCFKNSLIQYSLNLEYYQNLVKCYKALGQVEKQLEIYRQKGDRNPLDKVMLGLLWAEVGNTKKAIIVLDEFTMSEPNLIITPAVKLYIQDLINQIQ